jgi:exopolyphosphatase/guanosine-5'-triphosphate,3'-diphosphate pyrophosphatase
VATLLFRKPVTATPAPMSPQSRAIIDVGSNSIRLVVYDGPERLPAVVFNEKVMAGLGRGLGETGRLSDDSLAMAGDGLARFAALTRAMQVAHVRTVATAAVREASNGAALIALAEAEGLQVDILTGEEEAEAAGLGVLSGIPKADGIVGDLGGGSLELIRVKNGALHDRVSLPLGVLRIGAVRAKGRGALERHVGKLLKKAGWAGQGKGLPLYLVGGSWRALARIDMHLNDYPLPVIHGYRMDESAPTHLFRVLAHSSKARLKEVPSLSGARIPTLVDAAALLSALRRQLGTGPMIASAFGLREGLLYGALDEDQRREDPLIAAARAEGELQGRFPEHGDLLDRWIAPLFAGERDRRLRHAACLLGDVGWRANPEFRAERGLEIALHGNWVGIDGRGRAMLGQALFTGLGGSIGTPPPCDRLASPADLARASRWGQAIRFAQRLSAGLAAPLERSKVELLDGTLALTLPIEDHALYADTVARRHKQLATAFGRMPVLLG